MPLAKRPPKPAEKPYEALLDKARQTFLGFDYPEVEDPAVLKTLLCQYLGVEDWTTFQESWSGNIAETIAELSIMLTASEGERAEQKRREAERIAAQPPQAQKSVVTAKPAAPVTKPQAHVVPMDDAPDELYETAADHVSASYDRPWRVVAGGPKSTGFPQGAQNLYLSRRRADGEFEYRLIGKTAVVYPLGVMGGRSLFPPGQTPEMGRKPNCASANGIIPDERYAGRSEFNGLKITTMIEQEYDDPVTNQDGSTQQRCLIWDSAKGRYNEYCPLSKWKTVEGERKPPPCKEVFTVGIAVSVDDELIFAEARFKGATTKDGRNVAATMNSLRKQGKPVYVHPVKLTWIDVSRNAEQMNATIGAAVLEEDTDNDLSFLDDYVRSWSDLSTSRLEWARRPVDDEEFPF